MLWTTPDDRHRITKASSRLAEGECLVTWHWPADIPYVYIHSFGPGGEEAGREPDEKGMKLYTREEYKVRGGYRLPADFIGSRFFRIYACRMEQGELLAYRQSDADNLARVSGGRAKIRYSIQYGLGWFGKHRSVHIRLHCEIPVPKEALCYVKKHGSVPLHPDDGTRYPLLRDLPAGRSEMPEIQVGRSEHVRVFLSDGRSYGDQFEVVPE
ncbi:hypothetical protein SAMN02799630_03808 [Paenibacillus sp. UNCCL117]|uniref:hypothetical protein n=1 Tax=unclassified Paenibacillus TaxID=185978 RepID=UPI00088ACEC5|nr:MULTISPECIES: hypothetical protein [unclassified Paenibacillus]SDD59277.1 hypothetical protein SAMN04488602_110129 [Paenibacillus sp. cl123]SFW50845.1 hypothetical protein SAMN02799630_03808 [Paenibacillus sp. UNCCL117]